MIFFTGNLSPGVAKLLGIATTESSQIHAHEDVSSSDTKTSDSVQKSSQLDTKPSESSGKPGDIIDNSVEIDKKIEKDTGDTDAERARKAPDSDTVDKKKSGGNKSKTKPEEYEKYSVTSKGDYKIRKKLDAADKLLQQVRVFINTLQSLVFLKVM